MIVDMTRGVFRRIYSSVTRDRRINQLSPAGELLYWRLHCVADDFGAFEADAYLLQCSALPLRREFDQPAIAAALKELIAAQLIELYRVEGEQFGCICGFTNIQPCNRTGRRIRRYPPMPGKTDEETDESRNWTQVVQPEPSCLHQNENQSQSENQNESENENQNENKGFPPSLRLASECENISAQENPAEEDPPAVAAAPHTPEAIYQAYPRHVGRKDALSAIRQALHAIEKRPGITSAYEWLLNRTKEFAASPAGQAGRFCPHPVTWFNSGRYDDDANEWKKSNQPILPGLSAGVPGEPRPTTRDLPKGPTTNWGRIGQLQVKLANAPKSPQAREWREEIERLKNEG